MLKNVYTNESFQPRSPLSGSEVRVGLGTKVFALFLETRMMMLREREKSRHSLCFKIKTPLYHSMGIVCVCVCNKRAIQWQVQVYYGMELMYVNYEGGNAFFFYPHSQRTQWQASHVGEALVIESLSFSRQRSCCTWLLCPQHFVCACGQVASG